MEEEDNASNVCSLGTHATSELPGVGRLACHWKGQYGNVGKEFVETDMDAFRFHVVTTAELNEDDEEIVLQSVIPVTWLSDGRDCFLYPPNHYVVAGQSPDNWGLRTFIRHAYPADSWLEYDILKIETYELPRDFKDACKIKKAIRNGIGKDQWTDPERPLGRGTRRKKPTPKVQDVCSSNKHFKQVGNEEPRIDRAGADGASDGKYLSALKPSAGPPVQSSPSDGSELSPVSGEFLLPSSSPSCGTGLGPSRSRLHQPWNDDGGVSALRNASPVLQDSYSHDRWPTSLSASLTKENTNNFGPMARRNNNIFSQSLNVRTRDNLSNSYSTNSNSDLSTSSSYGYSESRGSFVRHSRNSGSSSSSAHDFNETESNDPGYKSLLAKIEGLEKEMKEMKTNLARGFTAVMTALKKNEKKGTMSPNEAAYHQDIVKKKFPNLPCDTVHKVFWLNTALEDINLSTSTVCAAVHEFRSSRTINEFVNNVYGKLISRQVSQNLQWKASGRSNDKRKGMSCLLYLIGVIGAATALWNLGNKKQALPIKDLIDLIQTARKLSAKIFRDSTKSAAEDVLQDGINAAVEQWENVPKESYSYADVDARITVIVNAVEKFVVPE